MLDYNCNSTYAKPDPKLIFQWKRKQSRREIELVETRIGALLEVSGYEAAHPGARGPGALEKVALFLRNKRGVWARCIERYGLRDPLIAAIGHRLGLTSLSARAQRRMEDKLEARLKQAIAGTIRILLQFHHHFSMQRQQRTGGEVLYQIIHLDAVCSDVGHLSRFVITLFPRQESGESRRGF